MLTCPDVLCTLSQNSDLTSEDDIILTVTNSSDIF